MVKKKIICTIEARMGSKRFPGKSLKKIDKKNSLIDYVINNALNSKYLNNKNIYILTSKSKNNKPLIKHIKKKFLVNVIIGSEKNVFSRYQFLKKMGNLPILRLTGDNPLIDPILIDKFLEFFFKKKVDYLTTRGMEHSRIWKIKSSFPKGISLEAFHSNKLFLKESNFNENNYEFPTWFFFNKKAKIKVRKYNSFGNYKYLKKNFSYTLDNKSDYLRLRSFITKNNCKPGVNNIWNIESKKQSN